ncbi:MAG: HAMP domain-containing histidine kinase [Clostridia bacterium]|nr:HAMP domain-containing histidine kinase [Clostridia bacterium]
MKLELNLKNRPFMFTSLVILLVAILFFTAITVFQIIAEKDRSEDKFISLKNGWEYKWDDTASVDTGKIDFSQIIEGKWYDYTITGKPLNNDNRHKAVWFRINIPKNKTWQTSALFFELMLSKKVEAYVDNQMIFKDDIYIMPYAINYALSRDRLVIPLQMEHTGKQLYIKVYSDLPAVGPYRNVYIGKYKEITRLFMRKDINNVILGFFFIVFGFFILPNVIFVNRKDRKSLIYLSCFILSMGCVFISISVNMNTLFFENNIIYFILNSIAFPCAVMSFMAFFRQVFFTFKENTLINKLWNFNIFLYFIIMAASILSYSGAHLSSDLVSTIFLLLGVFDALIQIIIVLRYAISGNIDAKIFTVGFSVYSFISLVEIPLFSVYGRVPSMYKWGILIFIAALMLILGRRFSDAHEKLLVYSNELVLNNEKLNEALTELKRSKQEVDELNSSLERRVDERTKQLKEAMDKLVNTQNQLIQSEKMAALGGLVVGVAHEINTPIGVGITAASHLVDETKELSDLYQNNKMKRSDLDNYIDTSVQSAGMILSNLKRAADLIRSFKKVAADQSSEEKRKFKVGEYINEVLISLSPEIRKYGHRIEVNCQESLEIDSYPGAFSQVITNLVMNSIIHAYDDGKTGVLRFSIEKQSQYVILRYSDDGKGIKKEFLQKIFDPFFTTRRNKGGTGLGLNIVYNIITQKFNGEILCESEVGNGILFIIKIPTIN